MSGLGGKGERCSANLTRLKMYFIVGISNPSPVKKDGKNFEEKKGRWEGKRGKEREEVPTSPEA